MKRILKLIALAMIIGITSCSEDECDHVTPVTPDPPIDNPLSEGLGMWYVESDNEEIRYDPSGVFYYRYSNVELSGESEGRYEFDHKNMKLTYRYSYNGVNIMDNWTVKNLSEFGLNLSSETASGLKLERIVESYKLKVGETAILKFDSERTDITVSSYSSKNERIASVSSEGMITTVGEKGTTYVKMTTNVGNVWAKITVGEDNKDLWCDYISVIGEDYNTMRQFFSRLGEPQSDGMDFFTYAQSIHQYIENVSVWHDTEKDFVKAIQLSIKNGIPAIEIESYLKSRYYEQTDFDFYSTFSDIESSKAIIKYDERNQCVNIYETQSLLHPEIPNLWTDFTILFGSDKNQVKEAMDLCGYPFLMSDFSYSKDGSDYYYVNGNNYVQMVGFVFNPDKLVSEFWVYMNIESNTNDIYDYLCAKYTENDSESSQYSLVFYNEDKSMKVTFDLMNAAVIYTKLTMKQHETNNEILGNYYEGLGMTHDQILAQYGSPYSDDGNMMLYIVGTDYVDLAVFYMDAETNKCKRSGVVINENISHSTIIDYLNTKYTVFADGTYEDGSQYAWTNGPSVEESTMGIIYLPAENMVIYQPLGSATNAKTRFANIMDVDYEFVKQAESKASIFLNGIKETRKNLTKHKSQKYMKALSNYNK